MAKSRTDEWEEVYSAELKDKLNRFDLSWYADNPCMSAKALEGEFEAGLTKGQLSKKLKKERENTEKLVQRYTCDQREITLKPNGQNPNLNCVFFGKVGDGKSSFGNLLTGQNKFTSYSTAQSGTRRMDKVTSHKYNLVVVDTPGFQDANNVRVDRELSKLFTIFDEGIHAFIIVIDLANPRITKDDEAVFKTLQDAFSARMLNHTFLVFTKADSFLDDQAGLSTYLSTIKGTFLEPLLEAMENRVIAVENKSEGYKRILIRQAVLDLLPESVAGTYTYKHFLQAQNLHAEQLAAQAKKKEAERKALHCQINKVAKERCAGEKKEELIRIIKTMPQDVVDRVSEKVKIEGMDPRDVADMVNCITKTVLEDCARACLKERIKENLEQKIVDPGRIASYDVEVMKRDYPVAFDIVGEEFFAITVRETVGQLKVSCITQFLLANLELYDNPSEIKKCLIRQYGAAFVSGDTIKLMKKCMDSEQVRACLPAFKARKMETEKLRKEQQARDKEYEKLQLKMKEDKEQMRQREREMKDQRDQDRKAADRQVAGLQQQMGQREREMQNQRVQDKEAADRQITGLQLHMEQREQQMQNQMDQGREAAERQMAGFQEQVMQKDQQVMNLVQSRQQADAMHQQQLSQHQTEYNEMRTRTEDRLAELSRENNNEIASLQAQIQEIGNRGPEVVYRERKSDCIVS